MANARKRARQRRRAKSLIGSMREFLTPTVFKQVRNASKRRKSPAMGLASVALHPLVDDLLLRRQPAREVRGGQGVLRGLLSQTKTSRGVLCGIREGRREASHARPAGVGGGDSRACGSDLRRHGGRWGTSFPSAATAHDRRVLAPRNWSDAWGPSAKRARRR